MPGWLVGAVLRGAVVHGWGGRVVPRVRTRAGSTTRSGAGGSRRSARIPESASAPAAQIAQIQRSRLLAGAVGAIEEFGYARTTVAHITSRARVSRRTFYELFDDREACMTALMEDVLGVVEEELVAANLGGLAWRERIRGGLWVILSFFDREPALARVCVMQALRGGPRVLDRREEILKSLATLLDEGRGESPESRRCSALTAEGLVGAAFGIVHARLLRGERQPLTGLVGELMSLIVLPYLGAAAARREQTRLSRRPTSQPSRVSAGLQSDRDPLLDVPMRLTYRTARVLECIDAHAGISNRAVAEQAGISDQGQVSKLLARLERLGLTANTGVGHAKGEPNAWSLTPLGCQVVRRLHVETCDGIHDERAVA
jgi:AcrR family transcriptional regulator/DNA-binding MarR family transcriptional regulator